jgi:3-ketosteroid 9alpha-monooxygenase subunit B
MLVGVAEQSYLLPVLDVVAETAEASSIVLGVPEGLADVFAYRAGQFLTVAVPSALTGAVARSYSLSSTPAEPGPLRVTVKRSPGGYASHWLCDHLGAGDHLRVLPPSGIFSPASFDADLLLFAGGSGITPVLSIIRTGLLTGTGRMVLIYANRDRESVIFADVIDALALAHPDRLTVVHWLETDRGLPTVDALQELAAPYASWDTFTCGPTPFMQGVAEALRALGLPRARRHQERFVSLGGNPFEDASVDAAGPARVTVELAGETHDLDDWDPAVRLIDHLEARGLAVPFSCRKGECSSCMARLVEGDLRHDANTILDEADLAAGFRLVCQAHPLTSSVRIRYE